MDSFNNKSANKRIYTTEVNAKNNDILLEYLTSLKSLLYRYVSVCL